MTTEQKAKAYDEAIERAKALYDNESSSADTLIACEWLRFNRWKYEDPREGNEAMEKDFKKAMKGE